MEQLEVCRRIYNAGVIITAIWHVCFARACAYLCVYIRIRILKAILGYCSIVGCCIVPVSSRLHFAFALALLAFLLLVRALGEWVFATTSAAAMWPPAVGAFLALHRTRIVVEIACLRLIVRRGGCHR